MKRLLFSEDIARTREEKMNEIKPFEGTIPSEAGARIWFWS